MTKPIPARAFERAEVAARPCLDTIPYRMLVFKQVSAHGVPIYLVAGSAEPARKADRALKTALALHGGECFYCKVAATEVGRLDIDHVEPKARGGGDTIHNLVVACRKCNAEKAARPIEAFKPEAGREWLTALLKQVRNRLQDLDRTGTGGLPQPPHVD